MHRVPSKSISKESSFLPPLLEENGKFLPRFLVSPCFLEENNKFLPRFLDKQSYNTSKKTTLFLMC